MNRIVFPMYDICVLLRREEVVVLHIMATLVQLETLKIRSLLLLLKVRIMFLYVAIVVEMEIVMIQVIEGLRRGPGNLGGIKGEQIRYFLLPQP